MFTCVWDGVKVEADRLARDDSQRREFVLPGAEQPERMTTLKAIKVFGEEALFGDYVQPSEKRESRVRCAPWKSRLAVYYECHQGKSYKRKYLTWRD